MEFKAIHLIAIFLGAAVIISSLFLIGNDWFYIILGVGVTLGMLPFVISLINETRIANEKEEMFLEFARNLVESVKTGTPVSKSIVNARNKPYGVLSENVKKLANQISLGIPMSKALQTFSKDVNNKTVTRALTLIGEAEKAGGDIGVILEAVAGAVTMSDKLKKERKAVISTLVVQGYIIFIIFMIIIVVMQFQILPLLTGIGEVETIGGTGIAGIGGGENIDNQSISQAFLYLLMVQGFFSGLTIGKLAEGNIKAGIKHSFILMFGSFLISSVANLIL